MMTLEPVTFLHAKALQHMEGFFSQGSDVEIQRVIEMSIGFTVVEDGKILGCCGVIKMWRGVGTWWMVISDELRARPKLLLKTAREVVELIAQNYNFHRFEVFMDPEKTRHIRFVEALGFTFEGRMIQHTVDKQDHLLYARIF